MKKQILIIGIIIVLFITGLSGCTETNDKEIKKEDFIGAWQIVDTSYEYIKNLVNVHDYIYDFFENLTIKNSVIHYNDPSNLSDTYTSIHWYNWNISDGKLYMSNYEIAYACQFSNNNNELRISNSTIGWFKFIRI